MIVAYAIRFGLIHTLNRCEEMFNYDVSAIVSNLKIKMESLDIGKT